ncbi:hypothetical protein QYM36_011512 [Artemia franciscana]|uniref:Uncharacterized protein n=1 Tax=Artemia franciscana TaxID=6661 RepID=A0AA88HKD5_ARTSF|nr:hypothetical protein QYM36_011512 [Artemia franciscana]
MQPSFMMVPPLLQNELEFDDSDIAPEHVAKIIHNLSVDKAPDINSVSNVVVQVFASCLASLLASLLTFVQILVLPAVPQDELDNTMVEVDPDTPPTPPPKKPPLRINMKAQI